MYNAVIAKINVSKHPNADRLQIGYINGARVIVGMDTVDGEIGVFFESDGQLSEQYCTSNDLLPRKDENGVRIGGGYFDPNRRVRAQSFRQVKSEGFYMPLSSLAFTGYDITKLKEGDTFSELNKVPICNKYYTKATLAAMKAKGPKAITRRTVLMPEHYDTGQFRFAHIPTGSLVFISEKEHGTSVRYGNVKVQTPIRGIRRWFYKIFLRNKMPAIQTQEEVLGTRRAILAKVNGKYSGGYYGDGEPYSVAADQLAGKLNKDEVVYGELVGYTSNNAALFAQNTTSLKEVKKQYGERMVFSYGCVEGTCKFKVYRITQKGRDLTWFEIKRRASELGVSTVSVYEGFIFDGNRDALNSKIDSMLEGPSTLDERHIREGVCIRVEHEDGIRIYKAKSWTFGVLEGYVKNDEAYVDLEESA